MERRALAVLIILIGSLLLSACAAGPASAPQGLSLSARVGFDGYTEVDTWTPVTVLAANEGADISGEVRVTVESFGAPATSYGRSIDLPRGSRKAITLYVPNLSAYGRDLQVELVAGGRVIASVEERIQAVQKSTLLIGLLSDNPGLLAPALAQVRPSSRVTRVALLTAENLPDQARGWEALDALVIYDYDSGQFSLEQRAALEDWVLSGGRLLIVGGLPFERSLAGIEALSPVQAERGESASLGVLASLGSAGIDAQTEVPLASGALAPGAATLMEAEGQPLLVEMQRGLGRVVFFAADPALEPLRSWPDQSALWALALANSAARPAWSFGFNSSNWDSLRSASASIPGLSLPSIIGLCAFLLAYTLLVGPLNYFVLTRLKRRELAWFTVPGLVILFTLLAYVTGFSLRGNTLILHQLAVVQSWSGEESARFDGVLGIWSPRRGRYDVEFPAGTLARRMPDSLGGGLPSPDSGDLLLSPAGSTLLRGLRTDVGGVQPIVVEGTTRSAPRIEGDLRLIPQTGGIRVVGDIVNYSDVTLTELSLVFGSSYTRLDELPAGGVLQVDTLLSSSGSAPAAVGGLDPYPANPYSYYYNQVSLTEAIGGGCWEVPDDNRRCDLLYGLLLGEGRGNGVYLSGWSDTQVFSAEVLNASTRIESLTLHIIRLRSVVQPAQQLAEIGPGLLSWRVIEASRNLYEPAPYGLYIYDGGQVAFRWEPLIPISQPPQGLRFDIESYGYFPEAGLDATLFNFEEGVWQPITLYNGANPFDIPAFIDQSGAVQLRIDADSTVSGLSIDRIDLTLLY